MSQERHYSVSQVQCYLGCPLKYRFQYVDRLPKPFQPAALAFGIAIHQAVEHFHRAKLNGSTPDPSQALELFEESWRRQQEMNLAFPPGEDEETLMRRGRAMLEVYFAESSA